MRSEDVRFQIETLATERKEQDEVGNVRERDIPREGNSCSRT